MKIRLFLGKLALFSLPFIAFVGFYCYLDPFKVVKHYDSYYHSGVPNYISLNKDYISTENWVNHHAQFDYDSYIFGNSRSMFYHIATWKDYVGADSAKCYHFDASGESIYGIAGKFRFLEAQGAKLRNVLIVMDAGALNKADNSAGHLFLKDPRISGESRIAFQTDMLKDFFDFDFLRALLDFKWSGKIKDYMTKNFLLDDKPFTYDWATNEVRMDYYEEMIQKNRDDYYIPRADIFYLRDSTVQAVSDAVIRKPQLELLDTIRRILQDDHSNFRIVISPLYDQKKINPSDLETLRKIFGEKNVFDFSGVNDITNNKYNYYEISHYRPFIADRIMKIIYSGDSMATK